MKLLTSAFIALNVWLYRVCGGRIMGKMGAAPILLLTSIAIKLDSRGPIFIREMRYGYKNQAIHISKFRVAMVCSHGEQINRRLTQVGQLLRQSGIDELPQLFNVLRGEMSFVDLLRAIGRDGVFLP